MKRRLSVIITALFIVSLSQAQTNEILTNSAIIKMVKAKLSNELIIDVIQSSTVLFDFNENAISNLKRENVSPQVIEAMKTAHETQSSPTQHAVPDKSSAVPLVVKQKNLVQTTQVLDALNYVSPIKELVAYYQSEAKLLDGTITDWDNEVRNTIKKVNEINELITQLEYNLREKKNADSKAYSSEILSMKKKLAEYRVNYKELKTKLLTDGQNMTKKLTDMSSETTRSLGKKYDEVSQLVKSANTDPGTGENAVSITFTGININDNTTNFVAPVTEMLVWHQNEINELQVLVKKWNPRVRETIQKDKELTTKLKPINDKLEEYKANSKKYKSEIATLKKQRDAIEKERKQLADQMENDSEELADYLKKNCLEIQNSVKERFEDIIGNINYSYQEKLNI